MRHETRPLRLLIIDDPADDRDHLIRTLQKGFPGAAWLEIANAQQLDTALICHSDRRTG